MAAQKSRITRLIFENGDMMDLPMNQGMRIKKEPDGYWTLTAKDNLRLATWKLMGVVYNTKEFDENFPYWPEAIKNMEARYVAKAMGVLTRFLHKHDMTKTMQEEIAKALRENFGVAKKRGRPPKGSKSEDVADKNIKKEADDLKAMEEQTDAKEESVNEEQEVNAVEAG